MVWRSFKKKKEVPHGLWKRCDGCERPIFSKAVSDNLEVCPECGFHFEIDGFKRIEITLDPGTFEELDPDMETPDPLEFQSTKSYREKLKQDRRATGLKDAAIVGRGRIEGHPVMFGVIDARFIRGSMGSVVGEKVTRITELAVRDKRPLILFCASGGARMQEGMYSLMQMAKTSAALGKLDREGGLYVAILTHPTTAGVMASFASLGDLTLAEPGALIGFTGQRVIQQTIKTELPKGFQRAEFLLDHGFIDRVVPRAQMRRELALILEYTGHRPAENAAS